MKTFKSLISCSCFIFSISSFGQTNTFQTIFGGVNEDWVQSIQQTNDGGYITVGLTTSYGHGGEDVYVVKLDSSGMIQWSKCYGGPLDDYGYYICSTKDNNFMISGHTKSFGHGDCDAYVLKLDFSGDTLWTNAYGDTNDEVASDVIETKDGSYAFIGYTNDYGAKGNDFYLFKTDIYGNLLWQKHYGGDSDDAGLCMVEMPDSGFAITGRTQSYGAGGIDVWLVRTDKNGNMVWNKTYGGAGDDMARTIRKTSDGGFALAGYTGSFGSGSLDFYLIKTDQNGDTLWTKTYGGPLDDQAFCFQQTSDSGYILVGATSSFGDTTNMYLVKTKSNGDTLWTKVFPEIGSGYYVIQTRDGGYTIAGRNYTTSGDNFDAWVIKTDKNGNKVTGINNPESIFSNVRITPNPNNGIFTINTTDITGTQSVEIQDIMGRQIYYSNITSGKNIIDLSDKDKGMYFVRVKMPNKSFCTGKMVIQ